MDEAAVALIRQILELGWPAISLIQTWILYRALRERTAEYIAHLEMWHAPNTERAAAHGAIREVHHLEE